jgi:MYXO-CTERM domain-containing protein
VDHLRKFIRYGTLVAAVSLSAAVVPVVAQTTADQTTTRDDDGFEHWGLLGLLGLAGLLGRKRDDRNRVEARRV